MKVREEKNIENRDLNQGFGEENVEVRIFHHNEVENPIANKEE